MIMRTNCSWVACDSRADMQSRLLGQNQTRVLAPLVTEDPNSWGFLQISGNHSAFLPVGYADLGLEPTAVSLDNAVFVGIAELVVGLDLSTGVTLFEYRMPTVFHEFVRIDQHEILLRDEIGFVLLSCSGEELWKFCTDLVADYEQLGNELHVTTFEGKSYQVRVGGPLPEDPFDSSARRLADS